MRVLEIRNAHQGVFSGILMLGEWGIERDSRAGKVLVCPDPVTTLYHKPRERVVFWAERDANPFFHFMEGLWMLAGRNDVAWLSRFNSRMKTFSDNGITFHGAYGYRWRKHFTNESAIGEVITDQLPVIAKTLRENKDDRRCVLGIWDPRSDLGKKTKDVPCNLAVHFSVSVYGQLDMTVFNRSNDIIWGCYGANAVHFSMLQEVMAAWIGVEVGRYWQVSDNWHGYLDTLAKHKSVIDNDQYYNPYEEDGFEPYPMVSVEIPIWFQDLHIFMDEGPIIGFREKFFRRVVTPMWHAWEAYKLKNIVQALEIIEQCEAKDWKKACQEWLRRRS